MIAGVWLLVMGVLLAIPALFVMLLAVGGVLMASQLSTSFTGGEALLAVAVVAMAVLVAPIVHVLAAIGVFAHKRWGRWVGLTVGALGTCAGVLLLLAQINTNGLSRFNWLVVGMTVAYVSTVVALWIRAEHFRAWTGDVDRSQSSSS